MKIWNVFNENNNQFKHLILRIKIFVLIDTLKKKFVQINCKLTPAPKQRHNKQIDNTALVHLLPCICKMSAVERNVESYYNLYSHLLY